MRREVDLNEITDGRLYSLDDMVKVGSNDCSGCSNCCIVSEDTIKLDPWDIYMLTTGLSKSFEELLGEGYIELKMTDGMIVPNLKLDTVKGCPFLNNEGRCSIHSIRPGFCRLFPLGRYYHDDTFSYILQVHECPNCNIKMKVWKWLDTPEVKKHEEFAGKWHYYMKKLSFELAQSSDEEYIRKVSMGLLQHFYVKPYEKTDFYSQFYTRLEEING